MAWGKGKAAKDSKDAKDAKDNLSEIVKQIEALTKAMGDKETEITQKEAKAAVLRAEAKELLKNNDKNGAARKMKQVQDILSDVKTMSGIVSQHSAALTSLNTRKHQIELKLTAQAATDLLDRTANVTDVAMDLITNIQEHEQLNNEFQTQLGANDKYSAFVEQGMAELLEELDAEKFAEIPEDVPNLTNVKQDANLMINI